MNQIIAEFIYGHQLKLLSNDDLIKIKKAVNLELNNRKPKKEKKTNNAGNTGFFEGWSKTIKKIK